MFLELKKYKIWYANKMVNLFCLTNLNQIYGKIRKLFESN